MQSIFPEKIKLYKQFLVLSLPIIQIVFSNQIFAQQFQVIIPLLPPYNFLIEGMWEITLINSSDPENVYLYGTIEDLESNELLVEGTTSVFFLPQGVKIVSSSDVTPVDLSKNSDAVKRTLERIGTLPNGLYDICIDVFSSSTNKLLGSACTEIEVLTLTQADLLSPMDGETVLDIFPVFNWLASAPLPPGSNVTYELFMVWILERQTPEYAIISNPPWFVQSGIRGNLFQYPVGARPPTSGQHYAWMIRTYVDDILLVQSEIWEFKYESVTENIYERNKKIKKELEKELLQSTVPEEPEVSFNANYPAANFETSGKILESSIYGLSYKNHYASLGSSLVEPGQFLQKNYLPLIEPPDEIPPFQFRGSYSADYQYSNLQGIGSQIPRNYLNLRINPTIIIYGIPLSANFYYSTQQQKGRQNINSLAFLLDPNQFRRMGEEAARELRSELERNLTEKRRELEEKIEELLPEEIEELTEEIEELTQEINDAISEIESLREKPQQVLSGLQGFLSSFNTFGIGVNYPQYTKYTLSGAKVTGLDFEYNPGWFYIAFTGWNNLDAIPGSSFKRNLLAGSIGGGSKDGTHLHLTMMKAWDDPNSLSANNIPAHLTPKENIIIGTDASLNLFDDLFVLGGEVAASMLTRDVNSPALVSDDIPEFLKKLANPRMSSQADYSYEIFSTLDIKDTDTKLKGSYKMVGPGYVSLGAPGIRRDVEGFKIKFNQLLFNRVISFSFQMAREQNNLISQSSSTSTYLKYGFNIKMRFKDAPYLIIDYRPNFVSNDLQADSLKVENTAHVFSLMTGLNVIEEYLTSSTTFVITIQSSSSNIKTNDFSIFNFTVSENVTFTFPLSLTATFGFINFSPGSNTTVILDFSTGYTFFNVWRNSIGVNYSRESEKNKKTGIYFTSSVPVWEFGNLRLTLQQNFYTEDVFVYGDRDEIILRAGISKSFSF